MKRVFAQIDALFIKKLKSNYTVHFRINKKHINLYNNILAAINQTIFYTKLKTKILCCKVI